MKQYKRALVVLSGGQDSTTCLFLAARHASEVVALTFNYGQRHAIEIEAAHNVYQLAEPYAHGEGAAFLSHEILDVGPILRGTSPLVDPEATLEKYKDEASLPGGIEKTFVPMRNALFIVLAANRAVVHGCDAIYIGVSEEDYGGYPDCRAPFLVAASGMIAEAIGESAPHPEILAPLLHLNKADTVNAAKHLNGCMEALAYSHTCYAGEFPPCGSCHACLLRARGFADAGVRDPLIARAEDERSRA